MCSSDLKASQSTGDGSWGRAKPEPGLGSRTDHTRLRIRQSGRLAAGSQVTAVESRRAKRPSELLLAQRAQVGFQIRYRRLELFEGLPKPMSHGDLVDGEQSRNVIEPKTADLLQEVDAPQWERQL